MMRIIITDGAGIHLTYELEHGPHGMLIHSPKPGVAHVEHVRLPLVRVEDAPLGGARLRVVGDEPIDRTIPRGTKLS